MSWLNAIVDSVLDHPRIVELRDAVDEILEIVRELARERVP